MNINQGDIFEFSINDKSTSYGQIVSRTGKEIYTIIIFKGKYNNLPTIDELINDEILFFGNTLDAKFFHKDWQIIGTHKDNLNQIEFPYYKIGSEPIFVENFKKIKLRKATKEEIRKLTYRKTVAPVRFEMAVKAYYKILEWEEKYEDLLYSKVKESIVLVET